MIYEKTEQKRIWIIGGANIDILGIAKRDLIEGDSNLGKIERRFGGVGRNIAQAVAVLGGEPFFVTCLGSDDYGKLLKDDCLSLGMNLDYTREIEGLRSAIYLAILGSHRDMRIAMNDMEVMERLDPEMVSEPLRMMTPEDYLIIDANLPKETIEYIFKKAPCPIAVDPVSIAKMDKLAMYLGRTAIFKPNKLEAEHFTGIKIEDPESERAALEWFLQRGIKEIIISMADKGILFGIASENESPGGNRGPAVSGKLKNKLLKITHRKIQLDNATGGGDSFLGSYVLKRSQGEEPMEAMRFALTSAVMNIERDPEGRKAISQVEIEDHIKDMEIEEFEL